MRTTLIALTLATLVAAAAGLPPEYGDSSKSAGVTITTAGEDEPDSPVGKIAAAYCRGDWGLLRGRLNKAPDPASLSDEERADLAYVRNALSRVRPEWWAACLKGKPHAFEPEIWGRTLSVSWRPGDEPGFAVRFNDGEPRFTVRWDHKEMVARPLVHNRLYYRYCNRGDLMEATIWTQLGLAELLAELPRGDILRYQASRPERWKHYMSFHNTLTVFYHGSPRARTTVKSMCLGRLMPKFSRGKPETRPQQALGALILAAICARPENFPSIPWPKGVIRDEQGLAAHIQTSISMPWTLDECKGSVGIGHPGRFG